MKLTMVPETVRDTSWISADVAVYIIHYYHASLDQVSVDGSHPVIYVEQLHKKQQNKTAHSFSIHMHHNVVC